MNDGESKDSEIGEDVHSWKEELAIFLRQARHQLGSQLLQLRLHRRPLVAGLVRVGALAADRAGIEEGDTLPYRERESACE